MKKAHASSAGMNLDSSAWRQLLVDGAACFDQQLDKTQVDMFQAYARELLAWNRRINLTTITAPADVAIKHFVDSLAGSRELKVGWHVLDLGSGGGFPGIPLSIVRPDLTLTLVDAVRKKTSFLKQVCRRLSLTHVSVVHARIEDLAQATAHKHHYDAAVTRALADLTRLQKLASPLLTSTGVIVAYRGRSRDDDKSRSDASGREGAMGWRVSSRAYRLPHVDASRSITCCNKLFK